MKSIAGRMQFSLLVAITMMPAILEASHADEKPFTVAAAQSGKDKYVKACRVRYRDCLHKNQIPSFECQYIYQDCTSHIY